MKKFLLFFALIFGLNLSAQQVNDSIDVNYLEDQLYISLTYNLLTSKPSGVSQNGFSGGFSTGFVKDIPLNEQRDFGFGIGVGYAFNAYIQNLKISELNNATIFSVEEDFTTNRLSTHSIEIPVEIRFRNSTPTKYKFWRVYTGIKFSYLFTAKTKFENAGELIKTTNSNVIEKFQWGLTLAAGYEVWNLYMYYGLTPLFKDSYLENEKINMKDFHVGLKLYIM